MTDALFPSGPWTGFYTYRSPEDRHRQDLRLTFEVGRLSGSGGDDIGPFSILGRYDATSLECTWSKSYILPDGRGHSVDYRGWREGKGIWGRWTIGANASGGFHIWPVSAEAGEAQVVAEAEDAPVRADETPRERAR